MMMITTVIILTYNKLNACRYQLKLNSTKKQVSNLYNTERHWLTGKSLQQLRYLMNMQSNAI